MQRGQSGAQPDPRNSLTLKQRQVMRMLARGMSVADAAREVGVNEERVRQWKTTPNFRDALSREQIEPTRSSVAEVLREPREPKEEIPRSLSARRSKAIDLLVAKSADPTFTPTPWLESRERCRSPRRPNGPGIPGSICRTCFIETFSSRRSINGVSPRSISAGPMSSGPCTIGAAGSSSSRSMRETRERRWRSSSSGLGALPISNILTGTLGNGQSHHHLLSRCWNRIYQPRVQKTSRARSVVLRPGLGGDLTNIARRSTAIAIDAKP